MGLPCSSKSPDHTFHLDYIRSQIKDPEGSANGHQMHLKGLPVLTANQCLQFPTMCQLSSGVGRLDSNSRETGGLIIILVKCSYLKS